MEGGIGEIDFGITATPASKKSSSKYPLITGPSVEKLVDRIIDLNEKFDAVADPFKAAKMELIEIGFPQFFEVNVGMIEAPSSMIARGTKAAARVTFKDRFTAGDKEAITALLGADLAAKWFKQKWVVKIDGDQIPVAIAGAFFTDLKALMGKHGVSHALEVKAAILPQDQFALRRHATFDIKTNLAINKLVPQQAAVSTKGVR